jgi:hypothetical protein
MFFIEEDLDSGRVHTHTFRTTYYAVSINKLLALMKQVGFVNVTRLDDKFYQPVLIGTKPI